MSESEHQDGGGGHGDGDEDGDGDGQERMQRALLDDRNLPAVADLHTAVQLVDEAQAQRAAAEAQAAQALQLVQNALVTLVH